MSLLLQEAMFQSLIIKYSETLRAVGCESARARKVHWRPPLQNTRLLYDMRSAKNVSNPHFQLTTENREHLVLSNANLTTRYCSMTFCMSP